MRPAEQGYRLEYQPIYRSGEARARKAEALLRWRCPLRGELAPAQFIPELERSGDIHRVGAWVLEQACRKVVEWRRVSGLDARIAVNFSPIQLESEDLPAIARRILAATGCAAAWIEIEITETVLIRDLRVMRGRLESLARLGFSIALDDFGAGYSSLGELAALPVDHLKIDASLLRGAPHEPRKAGIIAAVLAMARSLDVGVTVEGVERHEQLVFLSRHGDIRMQGFLLARPMSGASLCTLSTEEPARSHVIAA